MREDKVAEAIKIAARNAIIVYIIFWTIAVIIIAAILLKIGGS